MGSSVLDVGCGEGDLLVRLAEKRRSKVQAVERVCAAVAAELTDQGLSDYHGNEAEAHAYAVNSRVADGDLRNRHVLYAVE